MRTHRIAILIAFAAVGCASAARQDAQANAGAGGNAAALAAEGQLIFESTCASCHSIDPPALAAPPISHVARHYRQQIGDARDGIARIARWIEAPASDRSLLPAHAIQRWGVMPPLTLTPGQRTAVATWVWSLGDTAARSGRGQGAAHRHDQAGRQRREQGHRHQAH